MYSYRIKYRYNPNNNQRLSGLIKVFTVEAESAEAAKAIIVSEWDGSIMECDKVLELKESDLANNSPEHPGLQDLDLWTPEQMRKWIIDHSDEYETFVSVNDPDDGSWKGR